VELSNFGARYWSHVTNRIKGVKEKLKELKVKFLFIIIDD